MANCKPFELITNSKKLFSTLYSTATCITYFMPFTLQSRCHTAIIPTSGRLILSNIITLSKIRSTPKLYNSCMLLPGQKLYRIAGYFRRVFIFGYFEEAFFCENKFLYPTVLRKYILTINNQILVYTHVIPSLQCECDC